MTKIKSKRLLGVLLSAALLASMMLPSGVTAAEVGEAVGVTPAATTEATATDTAAEEVTTIAEVSETAATVDSAEVVDEDEEVTVIDEVSETAETVNEDSYYSEARATARTNNNVDVVEDFESTGSYVLGCNNSTNGTIDALTGYTGDNDTAAVLIKNSGIAANGNAVRVGMNVTSLSGDGLYFEVITNFAITAQNVAIFNLAGLNTTALSNISNSNNPQIGSTVTGSAAYATAIYEGSGYYVYTYKIDWDTFGEDIAITSGKKFAFRFYAEGLGSVDGAYIAVDNIGFYTTYDYDSTSDARSDNDVVVVQDFEYATSSDIADNKQSLSVGTGYLDTNAAIVTKPADGTVLNQIRFQTSAVTLMGDGLYFEIESSSANEIGIKSQGNIYLYDTAAAADQTADGVSPLGSIAISSSSTYTVKTVSSENGTYIYAIMIPWTNFNLSEGCTLTNGLSIRFGGSMWSCDVTAFDNIGFYNMDETDYTLAASEGTVSVTTDTIYNLGSDTIYAKVATADLANYSATNNIYPTTTLTYTDSNGDTCNYIFAGWYDDNGTTARTSMPTTAAYAKFVDVNVMTMGFQVATNASTDDEEVMIRLVTTVDSLYYESVGFTLKIGDWTCDFTTNNVYGTITGAAAGTYLPTDFSGASRYFVTATVTGIKQANYGDALTVTVYWKTLDGTTVTSTLDKSLSGLNIKTGTSVTEIFNAATGNAK